MKTTRKPLNLTELEGKVVFDRIQESLSHSSSAMLQYYVKQALSLPGKRKQDPERDTSAYLRP